MWHHLTNRPPCAPKTAAPLLSQPSTTISPLLPQHLALDQCTPQNTLSAVLQVAMTALISRVCCTSPLLTDAQAAVRTDDPGAPALTAFSSKFQTTLLTPSTCPPSPILLHFACFTCHLEAGCCVRTEDSGAPAFTALGHHLAAGDRLVCSSTHAFIWAAYTIDCTRMSCLLQHTMKWTNRRPCALKTAAHLLSQPSATFRPLSALREASNHLF